RRRERREEWEEGDEDEGDYFIALKEKAVSPTEAGVEKIEKLIGVDNLYDADPRFARHFDQALKAHALYKRDRDYIVKDGEIIIVDEFTGRQMPGRRWSEGLHQAIEAKEGLRVQRETVTMATITFQNYFRLYDKFHEKESGIIAQAGRTGAVTIATNMAGRGTDILLGGNPAGLASELLHRRGLNPAEVDKATYDAALAEARQTTDEDHERVVGVGGLHIVGTERHESRRIDNQLRGRAGRQGDPGSSRFYLSLEDDLMKRFASDRVAGLMERMGLEDDVAIESRLVSKTIESAQSRV